MDKPIGLINKQNVFGSREVGLTHPDQFAFLKLADNGDIHIMVNERTGVILSASQSTIFLIGDTVKFLTKDDEGLKWNKVAFNPKATKYAEPTFVFPRNENSNIYSGIEHYTR